MAPLTDLTTTIVAHERTRPVFVYRCTVPRFAEDSPAWKYLIAEGFTDWEKSEFERRSRRGSMTGNLLSFSARKLVAEISIRDFGERLSIELQVNTELQDFTQYNQLDIALELWNLNQLATDPGLDVSKVIVPVWKDFRKSANASFFRWIFTLMMGGRKLSESWKLRIAEMMPGWEPAPPYSFIGR